MGKELVISANRHETKVAILEDDQLVEIYFQRANEYSLAGSIHKGRVTRVLPGMQSAFVDVGLERDAFLYVSDFFEENEEYDKIAGPVEEKPRRAEPAAVQPEARTNGPAVSERKAEPEGRDRKGRRTRRRRKSPRGFPEAKYASQAATAWSRPEGADAVQESEQPESLRSADFTVLPGESLAKYRHSAPPESEEPVAGSGEESAEPVQSATDSGPEQATVEQPDRSESEGEKALAVSPAEELQDEQTDCGPEPESEAGPETQADAVAAPEGTTEAEPEEQKPADTSEANPEEQKPADVAEAGPEEQPQAESGEEASGQEAGSEASPELTAGVRGRGSRYPHRVSRRLRRKTRGAAAAEARSEEQVQESETPARAETEEEVASVPEKTGPSIADLLREGQEVLVQIAKEPLGQKGARITSHIALPGRYVVYMPTVEHLGVSRKVSSDEERARLKRILQTHRVGMSGGFIVRTAGTGKSEKEIAADMMFLNNLWLDIRQKAERRKAPALIHHDLDLVQRLLRDQLTEGFKAVWVDNEEVYERVLQFVERMQPAMVGRVKMYTRPAPIFDAFNITAELEKALRPKVWLKSGGYIVVNQTEALVAIDINTGKFVGKSTRLEDTIVKTNTEAIKEIVRQVRLRDLGGIIVIDFIDMDERKNRQKVMQALEEEMRADRAPYKILQFNDFGLVAITRKRVKQSLERALCSPCPCCEGAGYVKSVQTVIGEILQEATKIASAVEGPNVFLRVHPDIAKVLKSTDNDYLEELEEVLRRPVLVTGDPELHPEKFDLA